MGQYGINQNHVVAIEVKGLQSLDKFKEIIMQNGLECIPAENAEQANRWAPSMTLNDLLQNTVVWLVNYLVKNQLVRQAMEQPAV